MCEVTQSRQTLCDPMDCSLPGSSVHGDSPGKNTGVGCHALLQGISPTQGWNPGLLPCKQILYHLTHQGSPYTYICIHTYTLFCVFCNFGFRKVWDEDIPLAIYFVIQWNQTILDNVYTIYILISIALALCFWWWLTVGVYTYYLLLLCKVRIIILNLYCFGGN